MSLLNMLNSDGIQRLARQLNIDPDKAEGLTKMLAPAIGSAAKKRAEAGGLEGLLGQLRGEGNARFLDEPEAAASAEARADGEGFLESLFGSREATRGVAAEAAARTGIDPAEVESFLPALAAMAKGGMQKRTPDTDIDRVQNQLNSMLGRSSAPAAPAGDRMPDAGPGSLMGAIGNLTGAGAKPSAVNLGAAKPSHVDLHVARPADAAPGGKPTTVGFGMVANPPAAPAASADADSPAAGFNLGAITSMFDEDGDGSALDDILDRLMK